MKKNYTRSAIFCWTFFPWRKWKSNNWKSAAFQSSFHACKICSVHRTMWIVEEVVSQGSTELVSTIENFRCCVKHRQVSAVLALHCSPLTSARRAHVNLYSASKILIFQLISFRVILLLCFFRLAPHDMIDDHERNLMHDDDWLTLISTMTSKDDATFPLEGARFLENIRPKNGEKFQSIIKYATNFIIGNRHSKPSNVLYIYISDLPSIL